MPRLFCFGTGFSAQALIARLDPGGWRFAGTARSPEKAEALKTDGLDAFVFDGSAPLPARALDGVSHILVSAPPGPSGDPVLAQHGEDMARLSSSLEWIGYLSTTGVYGDHGGGWVDEATPVNPRNERASFRVDAERAWLALHAEHGAPVHIFRLAGIYGPGRNMLETVRAGTAKRIDKPGQVFSRIHVEDIAGVLAASIAKPDPGAVYNVCDDEPAAPGDVVTYACELLGKEPPPWQSYEEAAKTMSPMARSFYGESKRCRNIRIKTELGVTLRYPTYREGLRALLDGAGQA